MALRGLSARSVLSERSAVRLALSSTARLRMETHTITKSRHVHIDVKYLPQMQDETKRRYLFVAIDRATRWVFIRVYNTKTAANARRFLRDLERACPIRIRTISSGVAQ